MTEPGSAREAAERNAEAVMTGNLAQIMADITPDALSQMMAMGAQGGVSPASMPSISGYELTELGSDGDAEVFNVTFISSAGTATLATKWKQIMGQWKVTGIELIAARQEGEA